MKTNTHSEDEQNSQMGGTDQIEQRAAELAKKEDHQRVSDQNRKEALRQMVETSPAPSPKPNAE